MMQLFKRKNKKNYEVRIDGTQCEVTVELPGRVMVRLEPAEGEFFERADSKQINRHLVNKKMKFTTETAITKVGSVSVVTAFVIEVPVEHIVKTEVIKKLL